MSEERTTQPERPEIGNTPSDLRTMIADTLKEQQAQDPTPPPATETDSGTAAASEPAAGETRSTPERGPDGRFLSTGGEQQPGERKPAAGEPPEPAKPATSPGEQTAAPAKPAESPATPGTPGTTAAPEHWAASDKATFEALPAAAKAPFLAMYKRMETGFQPRLEKAATYERDYAEIDQAFAPHREKLRGQGRGPKEILAIWYNTEAGLVDPQTRDEVIANLIHGYGANPTNIARHLNTRRGFATPQPGAGDQPQPPAPNGGQTVVDPALAARLDRLEQADQQRAEQQFRSSVDQARNVYETFANAKDGSGNLLHPFLVELEPVMTTLARVDREAGKQIDLQDLYDRASWANPSTRDRLLAQRQEDEQRRAADERKAKADAARRASTSVTGAPGPGAAPQDLGSSDRSIRDEIRAQMNGSSPGTGRI